MANRDAGARTGAPGPEQIILSLMRRLERAEAAINALQQRGNQSLPADYRFTVAEDGSLEVLHVSTGTVTTIAT